MARNQRLKNKDSSLSRRNICHFVHPKKESEDKVLPKEECKFQVDWQIEKFKNLKKELSGMDEPTTPQNLLDASDVTCKIIFSTPVRKTGYLSVCINSICNLKVHGRSKKDTNGNAFDQVLLATFIGKICERFTYKERLCSLIEGRQIPKKKKDMWLHQYEVQGKLLLKTDPRSSSFLIAVYNRRPGFVYQVVEALLKLNLPGNHMVYRYINNILREIKNIFDRSWSPFSGLARLMVETHLKAKDYMDYLQNVKTAAVNNINTPESVNKLLTDIEAYFKKTASTKK